MFYNYSAFKSNLISVICKPSKKTVPTIIISYWNTLGLLLALELDSFLYNFQSKERIFGVGLIKLPNYKFPIYSTEVYIVVRPRREKFSYVLGIGKGRAERTRYNFYGACATKGPLNDGTTRSTRLNN